MAADRVWDKTGMFHARKRFAGYRLIATDTVWNAGQGTEVRGPISALPLLLTGRTAALDQLSGPGATTVQSRLTVLSP